MDDQTPKPYLGDEYPLSIVDESLIVYDEEEECPYLPNRQARMPLRFPLTRINRTQGDQLMESGFRRSGKFLYKTACDNCEACEAIRIELSLFKPNRSQSRAWKKGNGAIETRIGPPEFDRDRLRIFNKHRNLRGLNRFGVDVDETEYRMFLVETCLESFELSYYVENELIGVAVCDRCEDSVSAVYTFFDPDYSHLSPGTYSIMKQIEYCKLKQLRYLYLGYFVEGSPHMIYKQKFRPHQRRQSGEWVEYK